MTLLVAAGYLALQSARSMPIGLGLTSLAGWGTVERIVPARALVLREEKVLISPAGGAVRTLVAEGERVRPDQALLELVDLADRRDTEAQLAELDRRMRSLAAEAAGDREALEAQVVRATVDHQSALAGLGQVVMSGGQDRQGFAQAWQRLLAASRLLASAGGRMQAAQGRAQELERQRAALLAELDAPGTAIASPSSSLVSLVFDGLEGLAPNQVWELGPREFLRLDGSRRQVRDGQRIAAGEPAIKLVSPYRAHLVMLLLASTAAPMAAGDRLAVRFPGAGEAGLDAVVVRVGPPHPNGTAKVQLETAGILPGLLPARWVSCELVLSSRTGVVVPEAALTYRQDEAGVLVVSRTRAQFRPVTILGRSEGQVLVRGIQAGTVLARHPWLWRWLGRVR